MGFFANLKAALSGTTPEEILPLPEKKVALSQATRLSLSGLKDRQTVLQSALNGRTAAPSGDFANAVLVEAYLIREPKNKHDKNAIAVWLQTPKGMMKGAYLYREDALAYSRILDKHLLDKTIVPYCQVGITSGQSLPLSMSLHVGFPNEALIMANTPSTQHPLLSTSQFGLKIKLDDPCPVDFSKFFRPRNRLANIYGVLQHEGQVESGKFKGDPKVVAYVNDARVGVLSNVASSRHGWIFNEQPGCCEFLLTRDGKAITVQAMFDTRQ